MFLPVNMNSPETPEADKGRGHEGGPGETGERKYWLGIGHFMGVM